MAKTESKFETPTKVKTVGKHRVKTYVTGATLAAFGIFGTLSAISYDPYDLWYARGGFHGVSNWGGWLGARMASHLLGIYGLIGYLLPLLALAAGVRLLRRGSWKGARAGLAGAVLVAAAASIFSGQADLDLLERLGSKLPAGPGGLFGGLVAGDALRNVLGSFGLMVMVLSMTLGGCFLLARSRTEALLARIGTAFTAWSNRVWLRMATRFPALAKLRAPAVAVPAAVGITDLNPSSAGEAMEEKMGTEVAEDIPAEEDKIEITIGGMEGDEPAKQDIAVRSGRSEAFSDIKKALDLTTIEEGLDDEDDSEIIVREPEDDESEKDMEEESGAAESEVDVEEEKAIQAEDDSGTESENASPPSGKGFSKVKVEMAYEDQKASHRVPDVLKHRRKRRKKPADLEISEEEYKIPPVDSLFSRRGTGSGMVTERELQAKGAVLLKTLNSFRVSVKLAGIQHGPTITTFEIKLDPGVSVKKVRNIQENIALGMNVSKIRVTDPIAGRGTIGIEVPNLNRTIVGLREIVETRDFQRACEKMAIPLVVGRDTRGRPLFIDLHKAPHMLVGGATGSGKSCTINCLISSILLTQTPHAVKLIMIDPKSVELSAYKGIPHLLAPVETDMTKAGKILNWAVEKMEHRYKLLEAVHARNIHEYNTMTQDERLERLERFHVDLSPDELMKFMPFIVIIIDEWADLIMQFRDEAETAVVRITQKARAAGIHLILATQQPTTDVVTSLIKANIPTRLACRTNDHHASRVILNRTGAERLTGFGDMLVLTSRGECIRSQGGFIDTPEVETLVAKVSEQARPVFDESCGVDTANSGEIDLQGEEPDIFMEAGDVIFFEKASTSYVQRKLKLGYTRAARIIDTLINIGLVRQNGARGLELLVEPETWESVKARIRGDDIEDEYEEDEDRDDESGAQEEEKIDVDAETEAEAQESEDLEITAEDESSGIVDEGETEDEELEVGIEKKNMEDEDEPEDVEDDSVDSPAQRSKSPSMRLLKVRDDDFDEEFSENDGEITEEDDALKAMLADSIEEEGPEDGALGEGADESGIEFDEYEEDKEYETLGDEWNEDD